MLLRHSSTIWFVGEWVSSFGFWSCLCPRALIAVVLRVASAFLGVGSSLCGLFLWALCALSNCAVLFSGLASMNRLYYGSDARRKGGSLSIGSVIGNIDSVIQAGRPRIWMMRLGNSNTKIGEPGVVCCQVSLCNTNTSVIGNPAGR